MAASRNHEELRVLLSTCSASICPWLLLHGPRWLLEHLPLAPQVVAASSEMVAMDSIEIWRVKSTRLGDRFTVEMRTREVQRVTPEWLM